MNRKLLAAFAVVIAGVSCTKEILEAPEIEVEGQHTLMTKIVGDVQGPAQQGSLLVKFDETMAGRIAAGTS